MTPIPADVALVALVVSVVILYRMEKHMATNQQRLDVLKTQLSSIAAQTSKAHAEIVSKIEALRNQDSELDFSGLDQVVDQLGVAALALDGIVPDEIDAEDPATPETPVEPEAVTEPVEPEPAPESDAPVTPLSAKARRK